MPNPLKTYIERVEQTKAVRLTEETLDDFKLHHDVVSFRLEEREGEITYSFFWGPQQNISPLIVPWGAYVIVTWERDPGQQRKTPHFEVVPRSDFEEKFVEDKFPLTDGEMQFLKHLYAKNVEEARRLRAQGLAHNP